MVIKFKSNQLRFVIGQNTNQSNLMLPNSQQFLCISGGILTPFSQPFVLNSCPYNIIRRSKTSFLLCDNDPKQNKVNIFDMDVNGERNVHLDFQNFNANRWDSFDDYVLMINSDGDLVYINLHNKSIDMVKKQHPGESVCISHSQNHFITAGGYVKSLDKDYSERIIKIWAIDNQDKLISKSRFSTGHTKQVESTLMMNRNLIVTLSKDRSIRFSDINFEATTRVVYTPSEQPLSACQLNYNTLIYGGNRPYLNMIDVRTRKDIRQRIGFNQPFIQVTKIMRLSQSQLILCNVNNLMILDLNTLKIRDKKTVDGETIWALKVLEQNHFVIGNRGKFVQVWEVFQQ